MAENNVGESTTSRDIRLVRVYEAPVAAVWNAWVESDQVAQWWGPRGFTITTHSRDMRPGGIWEFTMHGPDGKDWPNRMQFLEVEPHAKLSYDHGGGGDEPPMFRVTVLFAAVEGGTRLELTMTLPTPEAAAQTREVIRHHDGNSTWDRLAEYLDKAVQGTEAFVINRTFDAPIGTLYAMWTDPAHIAAWLPPAGFTMEYLRADVRPGGSSFYAMSGHGVTMYGRARYLELAPPTRIVYTQEFVDAQENPSRHPMAPTWPATMLTTVTLAAEGPDRTRVTVHWAPHGEVTAQEVETFAGARAGMAGGWGGSFAKLEDYLRR